MRSVADDLRRDTVQRVLAMAVRDRIELALTLGDEDLARYLRASGVSRDQALRHLVAQRAAGRTPSAAASRDE
jgi:predicted alpha/beta-hydrolase family hydrolase